MSLLFSRLLVLLLTLVVCGTAHAEYDSLRRQYYALKRKDPRVERRDSWRQLSESLRSHIDHHSDASEAPEGYLVFARLSERLYRMHGDPRELAKAVAYYERLARNYKGSRFVDDGLLSLGDLRREFLNDETAARSAYFEIIDVYPKGDQVKKAKKRLGIVLQDREKDSPGSSVPPIVPPIKNAKVVPPIEVSSAVKPLRSKITPGSREVATNSTERWPPLIVIDPGHGGENKGAVGVKGVLEKDVVLNISLYLDEFLRKRLGAKTLLTRARDTDLELQDRIQLANDKDADLFISIHANASQYKTAQGIETYYLDNTNDRSSLKLAERENASIKSNLGDLDFILSDLIQNAKQEESIALAHYLQDSLYTTLSKYYEGVRNLGVKKAPFYVLVGAHMPCVLVEVSFIDHPVEGRRLISRKYQKLVAQSLYEGLRNYFKR